MGKIKIAFDLDGVFVDKPPIIPKPLLELLFKGCKSKKIHYRFPCLKLEQQIRQLSHFYLLRPPLKNNISQLRKIKLSHKYTIYLISSRYSFLHKQTKIWLKQNKITNCFDHIYLNQQNLQPHIFKYNLLKKLKINYYFEDDKQIVNYLQRKLATKIIFVKQKRLQLPNALKHDE